MDHRRCGAEHFVCVGRHHQLTAGDPSPGVDCEFASTNFPVGWYGATCTTVVGHSAELDWLRQFWDTFTNGAGYGFIPHATFMSWLHDAGPLDMNDAYQDLHAQAQVENGQLWTNWSEADSVNTVDW